MKSKRLMVFVPLVVAFCFVSAYIAVKRYRAQHRILESDAGYLLHYCQRLHSFSQQPITKTSIVFLGNSITEYCRLEELFQHQGLVNCGISGDNTAGALQRLEEISKARPAKVFIELGINDILQGQSTESILFHYQEIVERLQPCARELYAIGVFSSRPALQRQCRQVNEGLKQIAGCTFIDIPLKKEQFTDGIHLNREGYKVFKEAIVIYLN